MKAAAVKNGAKDDPNLFRAEFRELSFDEKLVIREIKTKAAELSAYIDTEVGKGREVSIAKTHLEDAVMWLTKFVSRPQ